jgi:hypothetical protein
MADKQAEYRSKVQPKVQQISNKIDEIYKLSLKHEDYNIDDVKIIVTFLTKRLKEMESQLKKVEQVEETFTFE